MELDLIIVTSVLGATCLLLVCLVVVLFVLVLSLRKKVDHMQATGRIRVQKLKMNNDRNHAFHNSGLVPDEELSKRGYSMYVNDDVESQGRQPPRDQSREPARERQTGGQLVDELQREIDNRQQRSSTAPPFLLQSIEENKRKNRGNNPNYGNPNYNGYTNPAYKNSAYNPNGRPSDTNPNFIY